MEAQLVDFYNEMPTSVNVIDKMNEEYDELLVKIKQLEQERDKYKYNHPLLNRFKIPKIKINSVEEYENYENKKEIFVENIKNLMNGYDNLSMTLWEGVNAINGYEREHKPDGLDLVNNIIDELYALTNNMNKEWCKLRILHALELSGILGGCDNIDIDVIVNNIMMVDGEIGSCSEYYSLNGLSECITKEWTCEDDGLHNLYCLCYYNCENCGKQDNYGDIWNYDGSKSNKLLCIDCKHEEREIHRSVINNIN
jgi:hypothetical protein